MAEGFVIEPQKQAAVRAQLGKIPGLYRAYTNSETRTTVSEMHAESGEIDNASAQRNYNTDYEENTPAYNDESNAEKFNAFTAKVLQPANSRPSIAKSDEKEKILRDLLTSQVQQPTTDDCAQTMRSGPDILDSPTPCSSDRTVKAECETDNKPPVPLKHAGIYHECSMILQHDCDPEETPEIDESNGSNNPDASNVIECCFSSERKDIKSTKEEYFDAYQSPQLEDHAQEKFYDALESLESDEKADPPLSLSDDVNLPRPENDQLLKHESANDVVFKWETAMIPLKQYPTCLFPEKPLHQAPILPDLESTNVYFNDVAIRQSSISNYNRVQVRWNAPNVTPKRYEVTVFDGKPEYHHGISVSGLEPGMTYTVHVEYSSVEPVAHFEEMPENVEVDTSQMEFYGLCKDFGFRAPLFNMQQETGNIWRDTKRKIWHYAMFKGKNKRKKIFTETSDDLKNPKQDNIQEIFQEICSFFEEGPAEIGLMQPPENSKGNMRNGNKYKREPRDVVADGIVSDLASDPPGQQSLYIPPGDNRRESYRLSTFEQFPSRVVVAANLARHGFVYTGFYDRVKCFSCGRTVERWEAGDNPMDRKWHKPDCSFAQGIPTGNIPIGSFFSPSVANSFLSTNNQQPMEVAPSYTSQIMNGPVMRIPTDVPGTASTFQIQPGSSVVIGSSNPPRQNPTQSRPPVTSRPANPPASAPRRGWRMANVISADHKRHLTNLYLNRELDRLASFGRWPTGRPNVSPVALARAGFFYLGDMDRTQCFSCGGVLRNWSYEDDAMEEHRTHFANCRFVVGTERRNVPIPDRPETPQELAEKFPCRFPMNPHMRSEASRLGTFDRRWQMNRIRAKPHEIAEAGFFFLGERDRVKCWYCNGGLQNWEYDDIPWVEHAKWFPNCQFMLQRQGQLFIYRYLSLNPQLPRPIIGRQDGSTIDPVVAPPVGQSARVQDIPPQEPRARAPTPPPTIIDPQEEIRKRQERVERDMQNSETVKFVLLMGYAADTVRRVLREKLESGNAFDAENIFEGTSALLDAVMKMEEEIEREKQEEQATNIKFHTNYQNPGASAMESMETAPSLGQTSGMFQVSDFNHDSDDEERDLYGSITENPTNRLSAGAVGGSTNGPTSSGYIGALSSGPISLGSGDSRPSMLGAPQDPESLKEFIEQKKEERLCKICFTENADMVFIPCSHMVCCKTCTEAIRQCPVCRTKIQKAIKTYMK